MGTHYFLAFDIGATSGRTMLAVLQEGNLELKELTRFANNILRIGNKYYWNIYSLFEELKKGLRTASLHGIPIESIGIDTWGVDFVYVADDGTFAGLPRAYRDPYTNGIPEAYFAGIVSKKEVYDRTGIQIMNFNSLFQLYAAKKENASALQNAKRLLFMPDALSYLFTGKQVCEYTIASTSQLLNPYTKQFETAFLEKAGISGSLLSEIILPGNVIGNVSDNIREECAVGDIPVIAVAGHDTASAVAAVPAENERFAYLSSGTWSLMGIEVKNPIINEQTFQLNFTNEGGVNGTTRFLKNITGMWLLEQCRKEWELQGTAYSYAEIVQLSGTVEGFQFLIDPDDASFANPSGMTKAIADYCKATHQQTPETHAEFIRCIFDSLALKYKQVLSSLQDLSPFPIEKLHIIGGGSQNKLLNQFTANAIGIPVVAGPSEATAIGNALLQAKGLGFVASLQEMRNIIRQSVVLETFEPKDTAGWEKAYNKFLSINI
ncbi:MAG: rhamnulokinase [Dysgonamonadaceae bacterium]|jgi:rhamnulokinase|nr:rhamnulokinase [Dysgonamonadaceae bacterium]